jgi:hypothetical protein
MTAGILIEVGEEIGFMRMHEVVTDNLLAQYFVSLSKVDILDVAYHCGEVYV